MLFIKFDIPVETLKKSYANQNSMFVKVKGMDVHYREEGKGKVLVLLHGTAASLHTWDGWTEALKEKYKIVRLDLPAFGLTGANPSQDYSIKSYVEFLDDFLQKIEVKEFILVGNSLGGHIAWEYALAHPEKVTKLILIDAAGFPSQKPRPWVFQLATIPVLNQIVRYVTPKSFYRKNLEAVYGNDAKITDELIQRYYELSLREGNREAFIQRAKVKFKDNTAGLKNITCPTLILWGEADSWIPVENAYRFQEAIKQSKVKIYTGIGHVPMEEIPVETAQEVEQFLEK